MEPPKTSLGECHYYLVERIRESTFDLEEYRSTPATLQGSALNLSQPLPVRVLWYKQAQGSFLRVKFMTTECFSHLLW